MSLMSRKLFRSVVLVALSMWIAVFGAAITSVHAVSGFSLRANPSALVPDLGQNAVSKINVTASGGFTGIVSLSVSSVVPSSGLTASVLPAKLNFSAAPAFLIAKLTVNGAVAQNFVVTVKGNSTGFPDSTVSVTVQVVDFTVDASPKTLGPLVSASGQMASSIVTVTGLNGYPRTVALSTLPSGLTTSLTVASCSLSASVTSCSSTLTVTAGDVHGPFDVIVDAAGGTLDHQVDVVVHVSDFSINASPNVVGPQNPGDTGTSAIIVTAQDGFTGSVSFLLAPSSSHLTAAIAPSSLTFTSTGPTSLASTLSLSFDQLGTYTVLVTGSSSGFPSHSVLVTAVSPPTLLVLPRIQALVLPGTVQYGVSVVSMPAFAGYDIMVVTNNGLLSPDSIDTSASILNPGSVITNCVNGGFRADGTSIPPGSPGNMNCGPGDGPGVAHSLFVGSGFAAGDGLLFTVNYAARALDYSISVSPNPVSAAAGATATTTVKVTLTSPAMTAVMLTNDFIFDQNGNVIAHSSLNGNYGNPVTVTLGLNHFSAGLTAFYSTPIGPQDRVLLIFTGGVSVGTATLAVSASVAGTYSVDVVGTMRHAPTTNVNGKIVHSTTVTINVS